MTTLTLKIFYALASFCIHATTHCFDQHSYFDTNFLRQFDMVAHHLITQEGFTQGYITTCDGYKIHYLFKQNKHAVCTVICSVGFWPGQKEGMATLYYLLPSDCNLLLIDARGHGKSIGSYYAWWRYGVDEYKDIQAAMSFAYTQHRVPVILYGICAGAFNAAHALCNYEPQYVRGLIMDSAWASVTDVSYTSLTSELKKQLTRLIKTYIKNSRLQKIIYQPTATIANIGTYCIHRVLFVPALYAYRTKTDLLPIINRISVPILYIHSTDDKYVSNQAVQQLVAQTQKPHTWWITQKSSHAAHHLKHSHEYRKKIAEFINHALYSP